VYDDQLPVGDKWEHVEFIFPFTSSPRTWEVTERNANYTE